MSNEQVNSRIYDYVTHQATEVVSFKDDYEQKHNVDLGPYPYGLTGPNSYYPERENYVYLTEDSPHATIERALERQVVQEVAMRESDSLEIDADLRKSVDIENVEAFTDNLRTEVRGQYPSFSDSEIDDYILETVDELESPQSESRLMFYREAEHAGFQVVPSSEGVQLQSIQNSMDAFYENNPRPSQEMEELIEQVEMDARSLDEALDRILELEAQGVENPLAEPAIDNSTDPSTKDRNLLKELYRKKRDEALKQRTSDPNSNRPDKGLSL